MPSAAAVRRKKLEGAADAALDRFAGRRIDEFKADLGKQFVVTMGLPASGKALALDTPLPTPTGWVMMGDIKEGDLLFDERGMPCRVVYVAPIQTGNECYELLFSDGATIVADAEHVWLTESRASRISDRDQRGYLRREFGGRPQNERRNFPSLVTTRQIAGSLRVVNGDAMARNHAIRPCGPLQLRDAVLPIDPYTLGAWLGDGTSAGQSITTADVAVLERVASAGYDVGPARARASCGKAAMYRVGSRQGRCFYKELRLAGLLDNKHVPVAYLRASEAQRTALLAGLMDTDGTSARGSNSCQFDNTNKQLADSVAELVVSLGWTAHRTSRTARLYGKDCGICYRVTFRPTRQVFTIPRKAARLTLIDGRAPWVGRRTVVSATLVPSVPVRCIAVDSPSRLFLAGKAMIPTHNTRWLQKDAAAYLPGFPAGQATTANSDAQVLARQRAVAQDHWEYLVGADASPETIADFRGATRYVDNGGATVTHPVSFEWWSTAKRGTDEFWRTFYKSYYARRFDVRPAARETEAVLFSDKLVKSSRYFVWDTVAAAVPKVMARLKAARDEGFVTTICYLEMKPELCVVRDQFREKHAGRGVGPEVIYQYAAQMAKAHAAYEAEGAKPDGVVDRVLHFVWTGNADPRSGKFNLVSDRRFHVKRNVDAMHGAKEPEPELVAAESKTESRYEVRRDDRPTTTFFAVIDTKTGRVMGRTDSSRDRGPVGTPDGEWALGLAQTQCDALNRSVGERKTEARGHHHPVVMPFVRQTGVCLTCSKSFVPSGNVCMCTRLFCSKECVTAWMAARGAKTEALTDDQLWALRGLVRNGGTWNDGCGWVLGTRGATEKAFVSLEKSGAVVREKWGNPNDPFDRWRVTDAGRAQAKNSSAAPKKTESRWKLYESEQFVVSDRYTALGMEHPDPATMCNGQCEGTGVVPIYMSRGDHDESTDACRAADETNPSYVRAWEAAEAESPAKDGWHFVSCPDCSGVGKRS